MNIRLKLLVNVFALLLVPYLHATSAHTFVSATGNDGNAGTQAAPYADFATALTNTSAGGTVTALTPGDFGPANITQAVTIEGVPGSGLTFSGGTGISVAAGASDTVVLRGLTVNGENAGGYGVYLTSALNLVIVNCLVENVTQYGVAMGSGSTQHLVMRDTTISNTYVGFRTLQSTGNTVYDSAVLDHVTITNSSYAGIFMRNGSVEVTNSVINFGPYGLLADTIGIINIANSDISYNTTDALAYTGASISIASSCTLFANNGVVTPPVMRSHLHTSVPEDPKLRGRENVR